MTERSAGDRNTHEPTRPLTGAAIEAAFVRARAELEIRHGFPDEVLHEAERVAAERVPAASRERPDRTDLELVTVDPPGSRDLDQAVQAERDGTGYRLRYAIADVGFFVDRGSAIEREAWLRGVTFYAPDHREPLYPPAISQDAASLLANGNRAAILFELLLDERAELKSWSVGRALVRSRAQLTYAQLLDHVLAPDASSLAGESWAETLSLLGEVGPKRLLLEEQRGGVSLPVRDQHVQARAAAALGYELRYEAPNAAERWNAEVSLLTGHVAALRMIEAGVGLLRTMPAFRDEDVAKFRRIAQTLGFEWPEGTSYAQFMHRLDPAHPHIDVLVRQARRVMRGAEYVSFSGAPPGEAEHGALAFVYAHVTAPLRRLADRYVLDLLLALGEGAPTADAIATLDALPAVMATATRRTNMLERRVVDLAEAWSLHDRTGAVLDAVVIDVQRDEVEVQVEDPPLRATLAGAPGGAPPGLGARVQVRVAGVDVEQGTVRLELAG